MKKLRGIIYNDDGSMIVMVLLLLVVLSIVGISAVDTSVVDQQIVGNNVRYQRAFFSAEGGAEMGIELMEQSNEAKGGAITVDSNVASSFVVSNSKFYMNSSQGTETADAPSATNSDASYAGFGGNDVYLKVYKNSVSPSKGSGSVEMVAGYEGKGKGAAGGGISNYYNIRTYAVEPNNSNSRVHVLWRHVL